MTVEFILEILKTRQEAAKMEGNTTELSFLYELTKMAENYKTLKEEVDNKNNF